MRLSIQYKGKSYTIYALIYDDGSCPAIEYLEKVEKDNPSSYKSLINRITVLTTGFHKGSPSEIEFQKAIRLRDAYLNEV